MEKKTVFKALLSWLKSSEMFARPSKQLPGTWKLYEYYRDSDNELLHFNEQQIKNGNEFWVIEFRNENYTHQVNLLHTPVSKIENGTWYTSQNYLHLRTSSDIRGDVKFQFAIEKGILKLLKKDIQGKIEFFGFFTKSM